MDKINKENKKISGFVYDVLCMILVAGIVFFLTVTNAFTRLDHMAGDALYQTPRGVSGQIKIIGIDEKTLEKYGPINTWSRSVYAELIKTLTADKDNKPDIIGMDIQFSGHVDEAGDRAFAEAAKEFGDVVVVGQFIYEDMPLTDENGITYYPIRDFYLPYEELAAECNIGYSNVSQDSDGTVRRISTENAYKGITYKSFPWMIYQKYCEKRNEEPGLYSIDRYGRSIIDYSGRPGDYEYISMEDVLEGRIDPRAFAGCIVLVGAYAPGMMDNYNVPTGGTRQMYGVEIHANILQAFMQNRFSVNGDPYFFGAILALAAALVVFAFRRMRVIGASVCGIAAIAAEVVFGVFLHNKHGIVISIIYFPIVLIVFYIYLLVKKYLQEYMNKARILKAFSKYVAPQIIQEISETGNFKVSLGGESRDISALFVDIRGFTTMSEALSPEDVVAILNQYLALTTKAVFDNMGTLDKFVGDCTMAVFNSPFDLDDYEFKSVCAAMDIAMGSEPLNNRIEEQFGRKIGFGVGVNCGPAVTGNIGCDFRMDYTAIGDTVNTAARLEANAGAGKVYISDVLYARVKERVDVEEVGVIPLKGKKNGVVVYSVTAVHKDIPAPEPKEMERRRKLYCVAGNMPDESEEKIEESGIK
ncbi:MAG: adenylate/guanylate cyclase domain-containing protein [Lachnospiraceae bacterium]|nr:adenylate/guanylate cyclase domain-containing protein [Lachnospiraceae bacterium]